MAWRICLVLLAFFFCVQALPAKGQTYAVTDLGALTDLPGQSQSRPNAINSLGRIAGANLLNGAYRALLYGGTWTNLGTLGGGSSIAAGVNASNQVAGYSLAADGSDHAFLWTPGGTDGVPGNVQMKDLGTLGGSNSEAYSVNRAGQVTGFAATVKNDHAFLYSNGLMRDIGNLLGGVVPNSYGFGINDLGQVAGTAYDSSYATAHAFFFNGVTMADLGTLGGSGANAFALNNNGCVAGYSRTAGDFDHAFRYADGKMTDLGTLGGNYSYALAVNNSNAVVGGSFSDSLDRVYHAFISVSNSMSDLNDQLDGTGTGWVLIEARAINDGGQIAGIGTYNGASHAFLLNPVSRILEQPTNAMVECHGNASFTVAATPPPLWFQWYRGGLSSGVPVVDATNATLDLTNVTGTLAGPYFVVVSSSSMSLTSSVAILSVIDSTAPVLSGCPTNLTNSTDPGLCSAVVAWAVPLALDDCDGLVAVTCNPPSGSTFNKGLTVVTCTASDSSGNTNSCVFTVTVLDTEAPVITNCPGVLTRYVVPGTASVPVEWAALMATDNCDGIVPVTCSPASGSVFPLGTNLVTCVATDSSGNTNSCTFDVIVNETQRPLITGVNVAGTNVIVSFTTVSGGQYAIESNSAVWGTGWTEIESGIAGTGSFVSVTNASFSLSGSRFYRVKMLPP